MKQSRGVATMNEIIDREFLKNMFLVECDNMNPYLKKGDIAIYEPIHELDY